MLWSIRRSFGIQLVTQSFGKIQSNDCSPLIVIAECVPQMSAFFPLQAPRTWKLVVFVDMALDTSMMSAS